MALKIFYLTPEIEPFCGTYSLAKFTRKITVIYNEDPDIDVRLVQPKYGFISERKYVIREVIRLRDLPIQFNNEELTVNLKSAFIPESRVQVYFLQYNEFYKPLPELLYKARNGRVYKDNDIKFALFAKVALDALKSLFWVPDVIVCNDWTTALVPALVKNYRDDEFYQNIKTAFLLHDLQDDYRHCSREVFSMVGLEPPQEGDVQDVLYYAMDNADKVVLVDDEEEALLKKVKSDKKLKEILNRDTYSAVTVKKDPTRDDWKAAASSLKNLLQEL